MMTRLAAVYRLPNLTIQQRCVLGALADCENPKNGKCCPKMDTIAKRLGMSRRQVARVINSLVKLRLICSRSDGRTNYYTFLFDPIEESGCDTGDTSDVSHVTHLRCDIHDTSDVSPVSHRISKGICKVKTVNEASPPTVDTVPTVGGGGRDVNNHSQHGEADGNGTNVENPTQPTRKFRQGLEWLADFETYSNPYAELTDKKNCMFMPAWDPEFPDDIWGCTLPEDEIDRINAEPIPYALAMIGETENVITKNALTKRMNWIGKNHFVGEVARMRSEQRDGTSKWENAGQILLRRLEYVYGEVIATDNHNHDFDVRKLWNFALAA